MNSNNGLIGITRTSKGGTSLRITLPKEVSEELSIGEGEFLGFYLEEGKVTLKKVTLKKVR
jgi:bifunctional DNA-binding transcriptional regulator/antitoxin component of YhaV-PrlF toxin-antitoxin module